jgi:serine/threonine protein kinase
MVMNLKTETAFSGDTPAAHPPLPPEQIAPHFPQLEILECLGRGGMGVVYKARQKTLNRFVALKLLAPERVQDAKFAERFAREAQALAALNHPNIVTIHDFGQAGGFYFLLMEFVDGLNLRQLLRARKFTPEEALAIVPPLCDALQFAHDRGIVHRDIKPENLLLDKTGRVKVADFGIAKMLGTANGSNGGGTAAPENATQTAVGTPSYSAPEQKTDPQHVDSRADIYSLGVVFYEMLTGELPCKKILPPSTKVQIDVRLDEIVLRTLEKKPELRYQQVSEVKTCVETIVRSAAAPSTGTARKAFDEASNVARGARALPEPRFSKAKMAIAIGVAVVLAAATAIIVVKATFFPAPPDSYFLPNYSHFQRLPSGLFILRPTHFSTPINGLDYSCETDSPSGDHVTWNMGRNRSFAQLLCRIYNCGINQVVLPPGAPSERFDYLYTLRDPNGLGHFEAAIKKLGYTAHWEDQPVRMLVVEKVAASTPSGQNAAAGGSVTIASIGNPPLSYQRYFNPTKTAKNLSFGPVVERTLRISGTECDFLSLRSGEVLHHSCVDGDSNYETPPTAFMKWVSENGVDVGFCVSTDKFFSPIGLLALDMGTFMFSSETISQAEIPDFRSVAEWQAYNAVHRDSPAAHPLIGSLVGVTNVWNDLTADQLQGPTNDVPAFFLNDKKPRLWFNPTNLTSPIAFSTRDGVNGLLQITGFTENPRGVKIRYKLVQSSPDAVSGSPDDSRLVIDTEPLTSITLNLANWIGDSNALFLPTIWRVSCLFVGPTECP